MFRKDFPDQEPKLPITASNPRRRNRLSVGWTLMLLTEVIVYGTYSVLVHLSKENGQIPFSSSSLILMMELTKLLISIVMYFPEYKRSGYTLPHVKLRSCLPLCIPAVLYTINNNIAVHMQLHMDPTTYQVLSNMKLAFAAVLYKYVMKRDKPPRKWFALGLLLIAAICDSFGGFHSKMTYTPHQIYITLPGLIMMTAYCIISGLASVSTEYILKQNLQMSIHIQNFSLYFFCIILNGSSWVFQTLMQEGPKKDFFHGFNVYTYILVITQATNGLIMSAIIKHGSNITRIFIIMCSMPVNTVVTMAVLGTQINGFFIIAAVLVAVALYLYYK